MEALPAELLTANAYRILGLPATATAEDVSRAARKMRLWSDPAHIPATPWDFPGLGPLVRGRSEVERAVSRLQEPRSRVWERILWFSTEYAGGAVRDSVARDGAIADQGDSSDPAIRHDAALAELHGAFVLDASVLDASRWRRAVGGIIRLCESDDYRQWMQQIELAGDFEKRATPDEVDDAVRALPRSILESLAGGVARAVDAEDAGRCARIIALLVEYGDAELPEFALGRVEEVLERNCRLLHAALDKRVRYDTRRFKANAFANGRVAAGQSRFFRLSILPLVLLMLPVRGGDADDDRQIRARGFGASALDKLGLAWEWAGEHLTARRFYDVGLRVADGTSFVASLQTSRDDIIRRMGGDYRERFVRYVGAVIVVQFFTLVAAVVLLPFMACLGAQSEFISRREHSPTAFDMSEFLRRWHGQHWVSLTGKLDLTRIVRIESVTTTGGTFGIGGTSTTYVYLWVPITSSSASPGEPVHIFAMYGSMQPGAVQNAIYRLPKTTTTFTGMLEDYSPNGSEFHDVQVAPPYLTLRTGLTPDSPGTGLTEFAVSVIIWVILAWLESRFLRRLWRRWEARRLARTIGRQLVKGARQK